MFNKPGPKSRRPAGTQIRCNLCKAMCLPKEGDWYLSREQIGAQVFICVDCGEGAKIRFKKASRSISPAV